MSYAADHPGYEITSEDQARNWVLELVAECEAARLACNVIIPENAELSADAQRKAYRIFLVKHGSALGSLVALHRSGKLSDVAYQELRQRIVATLVPTLVGVVRG